MAFPTTVNNNGQNLKDQDANNAAQLWKEGADRFETTADVFTDFEGGPDSYIQVENDTSKGNGQKIHFRVMSGFYGPGRVGNQLYTDPAHFEELSMSSNDLTVGLIRNGTSSFFMMEGDLGMVGELEVRFNEMLGEWMGREKTAQMGHSALHQCDIMNHIVANGRGDIWNLQTGDGLSPDDMVTCGAVLASKGGKPAEMKLDGMKNSIRKFMFLTTQQGAASLETDPDYKARQLAATTEEGYHSALFEGGIRPVNGHLVKKWDVIDHDGVGPQGSFLNPKAYLGLPIIDGTTNDLTGDGHGITGGGNAVDAVKTKYMYFRDFPRMAITFCNGETVSATASTHMLDSDGYFYVTIVNPANAPTDPNKWCIYRCSLNNGNQITVNQRLAGAANGIQVLQVGNVVYDATKNTTVHPSGALVYASNKDGKPLFRTLVMGKTWARRGYGQFRNRRLEQQQEGGAVKEIYIASVFGQKPRANRIGQFPGLLVLHHTGTYAGWKHP